MDKYYFPRDAIYNTSKFTELDWAKWWRDKALLDYEHNLIEKAKCKHNTKEYENLRELSNRLYSRYCKLDKELENN